MHSCPLGVTVNLRLWDCSFDLGSEVPNSRAEVLIRRSIELASFLPSFFACFDLPCISSLPVKEGVKRSCSNNAALCFSLGVPGALWGTSECMLAKRKGRLESSREAGSFPGRLESWMVSTEVAGPTLVALAALVAIAIELSWF